MHTATLNKAYRNNIIIKILAQPEVITTISMELFFHNTIHNCTKIIFYNFISIKIIFNQYNHYTYIVQKINAKYQAKMSCNFLIIMTLNK